MSGFLSGKSSPTNIVAADIADDAVGTDAIADDAVDKDKVNLVSTSSSAGVEVKGDGTTDGYLQLNCSQNTHGIKLKSPAHSASASYTLTFPVNDGDANQVLTTNGSGVLSFAAAGGGKILQAVSAFDNDYQTHANTSVDASAEILTAAITPSATSSKILVTGQLSGSASSTHQYIGCILKRGSTVIGVGDASSWHSGVGVVHSHNSGASYARPQPTLPINFMDSPSSTSELTYKIFGFANTFASSLGTLTFVQNGSGYNYNNKEASLATTSLILMEIGS